MIMDDSPEHDGERIRGACVAVRADTDSDLIRFLARVLDADGHPVVSETRGLALVEDLIAHGVVEHAAGAPCPAWTVGTPESSLGNDITSELAARAAIRRDVAARLGTPAIPGEVALVGAGPGPRDLVTLGALAAVATADVVVTDRLVSWNLLALMRDEAAVIDVAKIPRGKFTAQETINDVLVREAARARAVVRVKGGDPFVFGRGMEEAQACALAGIPTRVVSGVTSSIAVPARAGVAVTHRGVSQSVTVVSGHVAPGDTRSQVCWDALARAGGTLSILMGVAHATAIAAALIAGGKHPDTAVVAVRDQGLLAHQRVWRTTLAGMACGELARAGCQAPAVIVVGDVADVAASPQLG